MAYMPVRYIMEPEYVSMEALEQEQEEQQIAETKNATAWTMDNSNGTMYFFLDEMNGWRLVVANAAAVCGFTADDYDYIEMPGQMQIKK